MSTLVNALICVNVISILETVYMFVYCLLVFRVGVMMGHNFEGGYGFYIAA